MAQRYAEWLDKRAGTYERDSKPIWAEINRQAARELRVLESENRRLRVAVEEASGDDRKS